MCFTSTSSQFVYEINQNRFSLFPCQNLGVCYDFKGSFWVIFLEIQWGGERRENYALIYNIRIA